jgi:hypothetical protein
MANTGDLITRIYGAFRGADFRGEDINLVRSPDCLNVWKDYKQTESIRTRPKMALWQRFTDPVHAVCQLKNGNKDIIIVHSGKTLYKIVDGEQTTISTFMEEGVCRYFYFNGKFYFHDAHGMYACDGYTLEPVMGYVPTTSIGRKPEGGGTVYEDVNMLSSRRINTFLGDKDSKDYHLDISAEEMVLSIDEVKINGKVLDSGYSIKKGETDWYVRFSTAPGEPTGTDGQDNVSIEFTATGSDMSPLIYCTIFQVFDNRVFASGNPKQPNVVLHSALDDPTYWSDLDYYNEGSDGSAVKGVVPGNNALWVIKEPSPDNATVFYHVPTIDSEYGKIYPSTHSSIATGCVGKAINFNDDIVFFSDRGMEGISGDITTEQVIAHRSTLVDSKLLSENGYKDMILAEWEGYLVVIIGNKAYLADSRAKFTNNDHYEYEWFYWEFDKVINCASTIDGVLYLGTDDGVYTLTDNEGAVESYWTTPKDRFNAPNKLKTTNKRGCVVEAKAENISVFVKVEDTEYEPIGSFIDIIDYFVCRIKRKKWKDIQLKFYSPKRFSLEQATLEAFIGGYIKR